MLGFVFIKNPNGESMDAAGLGSEQNLRTFVMRWFAIKDYPLNNDADYINLLQLGLGIMKMQSIVTVTMAIIAQFFFWFYSL